MHTSTFNSTFNSTLKAFLLLVALLVTATSYAEALVRIDIGVAYTPEALENEGAGTEQEMIARITAALAGASTIYQNSGVNVKFNLVRAVELTVNNSATDMDTISAELFSQPEVYELRKVYGADVIAVMVEHFDLGAYANIPSDAYKAAYGGSVIFGRLNFAKNTFSHEIGHTLGSYHHRPDQLPLGYTPSPQDNDYHYGSHFIGTSGIHYRTIMSDRVVSLLSPEGQSIQTQSCNCFSGASTTFDGVVTGDAVWADNVRGFNLYAPFLAKASQVPFVLKGDNQAYAPWNGFLRQHNILELLNTGDSKLRVAVEFLSSSGILLDVKFVTINAKSQQDLIVNDFSGFSDSSYGLIKVVYDNDKLGGDHLGGRLMRYRFADGDHTSTNDDVPNYEFVFSINLEKQPITGTTYLAFNTFVPSLAPEDQSDTVLNWLNVINLSAQRKKFDYERYDLSGNLLRSGTIDVSPWGRVDIDGGHGEGAGKVGYNRIIPHDATSPYLAQLVRYGERPDASYSFAFPLFAKAGGNNSAGGSEAQWVGISTGGAAQNWLEVQNVSDKKVSLILDFFDNSTATSSQVKLSLSARSGRHIDAGRYLTTGGSGAVRIKCSRTNAIIAQSMFYYRDEMGRIEALTGRQAIPNSNEKQSFGTWNMFLGMSNWLRLFNTSDAKATIRVTTYSGANKASEKTLTLKPFSGVDLGLHETTVYGTSSDSYGLVKIEGEHLLGEVLRIKATSTGELEFVSTTDLTQ